MVFIIREFFLIFFFLAGVVFLCLGVVGVSFPIVLADILCCRLTPVGDPPSPRAAHAATAVGTMVVIQVW